MIITQKILEILFPPTCFGCRKYNKNYLCENCWSKIEINKTVFFPDNRSQYILAAATDYKSPVVQNLIQDFKYNFLTSALEPIKRILDVYFENCLPSEALLKLGKFIVVPIPLSKKRFRERGFNQAELIAKYVAEKFNLPVVKDVLIKIKDSPKQSEAKNWDERLKNIEDCFAVQKSELIAGKNIILVDDVFTSGATINEAVKKFIPSQGVNFKIIVVVVARAGR
ncbi:MAG: phosphoribosyltransferase family protein [Patescibacteria group bacterium]